MNKMRRAHMSRRQFLALTTAALATATASGMRIPRVAADTKTEAPEPQAGAMPAVPPEETSPCPQCLRSCRGH